MDGLCNSITKLSTRKLVSSASETVLLKKWNKKKIPMHTSMQHLPRAKAGHFLLHLGFQMLSRSKALAEKPKGAIWAAVSQQACRTLRNGFLIPDFFLKNCRCLLVITILLSSGRATNRGGTRQGNQLHWGCSHWAEGQHSTQEVLLEK